MTADQLIDRHYPAGTRLRDIFLTHSRAVARKALDINRRLGLGLDEATVEAAAMLHDIGICMTDAPGIECRGTLPYICHGTAGAALIREAGLPEELARVAERHTGTGLTPDDIERQELPLPPGDYMPRTRLERLICYADKFYSKGGGGEKTAAEARRSAAHFGCESLARFDALDAEFGGSVAVAEESGGNLG